MPIVLAGLVWEMKSTLINRNKVFVDYLNNCTEEVILDDQGWGDFPVQEASLSAWVNKDAH